MRLKQAQEEAEAEVARYKQERETQFQAWLNQNSSGSSDITANLEKDTKAQLATLDQETNASMYCVFIYVLCECSSPHLFKSPFVCCRVNVSNCVQLQCVV